MTTSTGFIGLGVMGQPMALHLARAGLPLTVWSRTAVSGEPLGRAGARVAATAEAVFRDADPVILMLANEQAIDEVLARGSPGFGARVADRTIVQMGTTSPRYSLALGMDIVAAGGRYVEAPVSGSRVPAEEGQLVAMVAGDERDVAAVRELIAPMCRLTFACGPVPGALRMKLAINHYLITMVTGLCEAAHFARELGVDMPQYRAVLDAGPMASGVSRMKLPKLVEREFSVQASIADVRMNTRLIVDAARLAGLATPMLDRSLELFEQAVQMGLGSSDMVGVVQVLERLTAEAR